MPVVQDQTIIYHTHMLILSFTEFETVEQELVAGYILQGCLGRVSFTALHGNMLAETRDVALLD